MIVCRKLHFVIVYIIVYVDCANKRHFWSSACTAVCNSILVTKIFCYQHSTINNTVKNIFQQNLVIVWAVYWRLTVRQFVQIHWDLTFLLYNVQGFTFFEAQCMMACCLCVWLWILQLIYTVSQKNISDIFDCNSQKNFADCVMEKFKILNCDLVVLYLQPRCHPYTVYKLNSFFT